MKKRTLKARGFKPVMLMNKKNPAGTLFKRFSGTVGLAKASTKSS